MTRFCLEVQGIVVEYGSQKVLDGVCLEVEAGAHLAVIGRSGSGKSTLLRIIAGLEAPAGGLVLLPESSSGCSCAYPMQASVAYAPVSAGSAR